MILINVVGSLPIRAAKQFNSGRKIGKCHQNVLVFFKGDPSTIKATYGPLDFSKLEDMFTKEIGEAKSATIPALDELSPEEQYKTE